MIEHWSVETNFRTNRFIVEQNLKDQPKMGDGISFPIPCPPDYFPTMREVHIWIFDTMEEAIEKVPEKYRKDMGLTN